MKTAYLAAAILLVSAVNQSIAQRVVSPMHRSLLLGLVLLIGMTTSVAAQSCADLCAACYRAVGADSVYNQQLGAIMQYCNACNNCRQGGGQPQSTGCPGGYEPCGNMCCGAGNYCSRYGCIARGSVDCGNGSCPPGQKCARNGRGCYPEDAVDCGEYSCESGKKCGNGWRACLVEDAVDCGPRTKNACPAGKVCWTASTDVPGSLKTGQLYCLTEEQVIRAADMIAQQKRRQDEEKEAKRRAAQEKREAKRREEEEKKAAAQRKKEEAQQARIQAAEDAKRQRQERLAEIARQKQEAADAKQRSEQARRMAAEVEAKRRQEETTQRVAAAKLAAEEKHKREQELRANRSLEAMSRTQTKPTAPHPTTAHVVTPLEGIELLAKNKDAKIRKLTPIESINEIANGRDPKGLWVVETRLPQASPGASHSRAVPGPPSSPPGPTARLPSAATTTNPIGLADAPALWVTTPAAPPVITAPSSPPSHPQASTPRSANVSGSSSSAPPARTTTPSPSNAPADRTAAASASVQHSAPSPTSANRSATSVQSSSTFSAPGQKSAIEEFFSQRTSGSTRATLPPKAPDPVKDLWNGVERGVQVNNEFLKSRPGQLITETLAAAGGPYAKAAMPTTAKVLGRGSKAALAIETFQKRDWLGGLQKGADKAATYAAGGLGAAATPWNPTLGASVGAGTTQFVLSSYRLYGAPVVGDWLVKTFPDTFIPAQRSQ